MKHAEGRNHSSYMWHKDERGRDLSAAVVSPHNVSGRFHQGGVAVCAPVLLFALDHVLSCFMDTLKYLFLHGSTRYSPVTPPSLKLISDIANLMSKILKYYTSLFCTKGKGLA